MLEIVNFLYVNDIDHIKLFHVQMTILLRMDDKMNRQLTCPVNPVDDTPMVLVQELVHYGFIHDVCQIFVVLMLRRSFCIDRVTIFQSDRDKIANLIEEALRRFNKQVTTIPGTVSITNLLPQTKLLLPGPELTSIRPIENTPTILMSTVRPSTSTTTVITSNSDNSAIRNLLPKTSGLSVSSSSRRSDEELTNQATLTSHTETGS